MGRVYLARQNFFDRDVALKVVQPQFASDPQFADRFRSEMRLAAQLDHPSIVPVYEAGEQGDQLYIAMKFVDGENLAQRIGRSGALDPADAVEVVAKIASGLDEAHRKRILHRDVKPANILIESGTGRVFLTDFGIAKSLEATQSLTGTGLGVGAIRYMSPEQIENKDLDERSDVYSLGCVLLEALTGINQYADESMSSILLKKINEDPPAPSELSPRLGEAFDGVLSRALARDPRDRYASAGQLADAAEAALKGHDETVVIGSSDPAPTRKLRTRSENPPDSERQASSLRSRVPWMVAASLGILVLFLAGFVLSRDGSKDGTENEPKSTTIENQSSDFKGNQVSEQTSNSADQKIEVNSGTEVTSKPVPTEPAAASTEVTEVNRRYFDAKVPLGWVPDEIDEQNSGRLTNRWVNPTDDRVYVLIDSQTPAPVASAAESAAEVRALVEGGDGYVERSFSDAYLGGWPSAVWEFDDGDERKIDIFQNQCNYGFAILGVAPPESFSFYRSTFVNVAKSVTSFCE